MVYTVSHGLVAMVLLTLMLGVQGQGNNGYFLQITDFHYDPTYWTTQESCNMPIPQNELGKYGHYECDPNWDLVEESISAMREKEGQPDFIMWTGDTGYHPRNKTTTILNEELLLDCMKNITDLIVEKYGSGIPVFPVLGNHDYKPTNQLPGNGNSSIYNTLADTWKDWVVGDANQDTFKLAGYYAGKVGEKMAVIVLNTNLYLPSNKVTTGQTDPGQQYVWLQQQFDNARSSKSRAHVILHVPVGVNEGDSDYQFLVADHNAKLHKIFRDNADVIIGLYTAHEHTDSFRMFYKDGQPVATMYVAPGVTPWRYPGSDKTVPRNPSFRKITYDKTTLDLTDIEQFYLDLKETNKNLSMKPEWKSEYSYRRTYDLSTGVNPKLLQGVLDDFKTFASNKFHDYYTFNNVKVPMEYYKPCDCECKISHLCGIEFVDFTEHAKCIQETTCSGTSVAGSLTMVLLATLLNYLMK